MKNKIKYIETIVFAMFLFLNIHISNSFAITTGGAGNSNLDKFSGNVSVAGIMTGSLILGSSDVTIDNGEINYDTYYMGILGEGGVDDDLDSINGGSDGTVISLFPINKSSDIRLRDGVGNLNLNGANITMKHLGDITVLRKSNGTQWDLIFTNA